MSAAEADGRRWGAVGAVVLAAIVALAVGWVLFVFIPGGNGARLFGVVLAVGLGVAGARVGTRIVAARFPGYNVASVSVEGPISRDGSGRVPGRGGGRSANDVVEAIERADADANARGLVVELNTPGGEVVPSEDIRLAAERFEGPTIAYATDTCASGGYWIASGCDEFVSREGSIIGSIGVVGSRPNASGLADRLGVSYEQFTAGEYKDAGTPLKEISGDERTYLQGIVDEYYEQFVDRVAAGRGLDPETIRDTEARIFLGTEALERGLVDDLGTRDDVKGRFEKRLDEPEITIQEFEAPRGVTDRLRGGALATAFAFGAGIASAITGEDGSEVRFRI